LHEQVADGAGAPAFLWPIPERRDGRRFRLGEPPAGATRPFDKVLLSNAEGLRTRVFHFVAVLRMRLLAARLSGRSLPPTPPLRGRCGFFGRSEAQGSGDPKDRWKGEAEGARRQVMGQVLEMGSGGNSSKKRASRARAAERAGSAPPRGSLYDEVTARIIAELEEGRFPWVQPWSNAAASPGLPRNATTGRAYSGVNVLILWGAVIAGAYPNQGWLTFRQALAAGGCVRKGEQGVTVCYADRFTPEAEKQRSAEHGDDARSIPFLKRFVVFNVAQCDGLPEQYSADAPPLPERELMPVAESLIDATGADFRIGGARAFYSPNEDFVQVPP
jgi:N-terminal domain of anti-restriction factor ArdC